MRFRVNRAVLPLLALLACAADGTPATRIDLAPPAVLPPLAEAVIVGRNDTAAPALIVLRADDMPGADYAHRVNAERVVAPGLFTIRLRLAALRTPRGRPLDLAHLARLSAFSPDGAARFTSLRLVPAAALPPGVLGWFFGPAAELPLAGLIAVAPDDPAVSGPAVRRVERASADPVLRWGIRLTRFETRLPPGHWRISLWTEDPGEWETLPPVLSRRIRLNGRTVLQERRTPAEWVAQRYLAGRALEADPDQSPFAALGARRGGRIDAVVDVPDGRLVLELAGHRQAATHLALMVAAPVGGPDGVAAVEALRRARFAEAWPVLMPPPPPPSSLLAGASGPVLSLSAPEAAVTAPGGLAVFHLAATAAADGVAAATLSSGPLPARLLWGQWRWRRPAADMAGLVFAAGQLRADPAIPLRARLARPLVVTVPVPAGTAPGTYRLRLALSQGGHVAARDWTLTVLPARRPAPRPRVGVFLDFAPHLADDPAAARRQAGCDLHTLAGLGFSTVAPALSLPDADLPGFLADLRAAEATFPAPLIAYAPARHLALTLGPAKAAAVVARAEDAARAAGVVPPVWSVADEPSAAGTLAPAQALAAALRVARPGIRLAGHLNDPADRRILQDLQIATVNPRFGVAPEDIAALRRDGLSPWLYNMPRLRLAAGFWLWRSGADGMLQWHARMPTADAFDPTDGREADIQFLWPTQEVCGPPDIDAQLLELAEGAEDLRWLAWLDARAAAGSAPARALRTRLWHALDAGWRPAAARPQADLDAWRAAIAALARGLM